MANQEAIFASFFPFLFVGMWLLITAILSRLAGWRGLAERYPDRLEPPLVRLGMQSGAMGMDVNYNGCLTLVACRSGLRVSVWRIFGVFDKPFFVPWGEVVAPQSVTPGEMVKLTFGRPKVGALTIRGRTWMRLSSVLAA